MCYSNPPAGVQLRNDECIEKTISGRSLAVGVVWLQLHLKQSAHCISHLHKTAKRPSQELPFRHPLPNFQGPPGNGAAPFFGLDIAWSFFRGLKCSGNSRAANILFRNHAWNGCLAAQHFDRHCGRRRPRFHTEFLVNAFEMFLHCARTDQEDF